MSAIILGEGINSIYNNFFTPNVYLYTGSIVNTFIVSIEYDDGILTVVDNNGVQTEYNIANSNIVLSGVTNNIPIYNGNDGLDDSGISISQLAKINTNNTFSGRNTFNSSVIFNGSNYDIIFKDGFTIGYNRDSYIINNVNISSKNDILEDNFSLFNDYSIPTTLLIKKALDILAIRIDNIKGSNDIDISNLVTLNTTQTIDALKTFNKNVTILSSLFVGTSTAKRNIYLNEKIISDIDNISLSVGYVSTTRIPTSKVVREYIESYAVSGVMWEDKVLDIVDLGSHRYFGGTIEYTNIVVSSNTATCTTPSDHLLETNDVIYISGETDDADLNGTYKITATSSDQFTFTTLNVSDDTYTKGTIFGVVLPYTIGSISSDVLTLTIPLTTYPNLIPFVGQTITLSGFSTSNANGNYTIVSFTDDGDSSLITINTLNVEDGLLDTDGIIYVNKVDGDRYISSTTVDSFTKNNIYTYNSDAWEETVVYQNFSCYVQAHKDYYKLFNSNGVLVWVKENSTISHNSTNSKQGGIDDEYYHLTEDDYNFIISKTNVNSITSGFVPKIDDDSNTLRILYANNGIAYWDINDVNGFLTDQATDIYVNNAKVYDALKYPVGQNMIYREYLKLSHIDAISSVYTNEADRQCSLYEYKFTSSASNTFSENIIVTITGNYTGRVIYGISGTNNQSLGSNVLKQLISAEGVLKNLVGMSISVTGNTLTVSITISHKVARTYIALPSLECNVHFEIYDVGSTYLVKLNKLSRVYADGFVAAGDDTIARNDSENIFLEKNTFNEDVYIEGSLTLDGLSSSTSNTTFITKKSSNNTLETRNISNIDVLDKFSTSNGELLWDSSSIGAGMSIWEDIDIGSINEISDNYVIFFNSEGEITNYGIKCGMAIKAVFDTIGTVYGIVREIYGVRIYFMCHAFDTLENLTSISFSKLPSTVSVKEFFIPGSYDRGATYSDLINKNFGYQYYYSSQSAYFVGMALISKTIDSGTVTNHAKITARSSSGDLDLMYTPLTVSTSLVHTDNIVNIQSQFNIENYKFNMLNDILDFKVTTATGSSLNYDGVNLLIYAYFVID